MAVVEVGLCGVTGLVWLRIGTGGELFECGNEPSGSIKWWETTEWLHSWWPLKWYSAPQNVVCVLCMWIFLD
jgi:hypothetical protein